MKRTPLVRKTPMKRSAVALARRALAPMSARRRSETTERRELVRAVLDAHPTCQRCDAARSVDVHEPHTRGRGGSPLDRSNVVALCRACHDWVHTHPVEAATEGWLRRSTG